MTRKTILGDVPGAHLNGAVAAADMSITIDSATGWPDGSAGPFAVKINRGRSNEESLLITSRAGTTLTVDTRGHDGTTAQDHATSSLIEHYIDAETVDEANQIANVMTTRGDIIYRGASLPSRLAKSATAGHVLKQGADDPEWGQVVTAGITDLAVTAGKLAADAVTTAKVLDSNITTAKIADANVTQAKMALAAVGDSGDGTAASTSYAALSNPAEVAVGVGRWTILAKGKFQCAGATNGTYLSAQLWNGAAEVDNSDHTLPSTGTGRGMFVLLHTVTVVAPTTFSVRVKTSIVGGTQEIFEVRIAAIPA